MAMNSLKYGSLEATRTRCLCWEEQRLILFGAGMILSNPVVRRYLGQLGSRQSWLLAALPDLIRYMKLRAM